MLSITNKQHEHDPALDEIHHPITADAQNSKSGQRMAEWLSEQFRLRCELRFNGAAYSPARGRIDGLQVIPNTNIILDRI